MPLNDICYIPATSISMSVVGIALKSYDDVLWKLESNVAAGDFALTEYCYYGRMHSISPTTYGYFPG
jgi:hypothetical protein